MQRHHTAGHPTEQPCAPRASIALLVWNTHNQKTGSPAPLMPTSDNITDYYPRGFYTSPDSHIYWLIGPLGNDEVNGVRDVSFAIEQNNTGRSLYHIINRNTFDHFADPLPSSASATTSTLSPAATVSRPFTSKSSASDAPLPIETQTDEAIGTMRILRTYIYERPPNADGYLPKLNAYDGPTLTLVKTAAWPAATDASATNKASSDSDDDVSPGTIVGAVLGVLILVFLLILVCWCCGCCCCAAYSAKRRRKPRPDPPSPQPRTIALREIVDVESRASEAGELRPSGRPSSWVFEPVEVRRPEQSHQQTVASGGREGDDDREEPLPLYQEPPPPKYSKMDESSRGAR